MPLPGGPERLRCLAAVRRSTPLLLLPGGATSLQLTEPSVAHSPVPALLTAASRRLAEALQMLPPAALEQLRSTAVLHLAGKISFSPCPPYFPLPGVPHFHHSSLLFRQRKGGGL